MSHGCGDRLATENPQAVISGVGKSVEHMSILGIPQSVDRSKLLPIQIHQRDSQLAPASAVADLRRWLACDDKCGRSFEESSERWRRKAVITVNTPVPRPL